MPPSSESDSDSIDETGARLIDASAAPTGGGSMELTPEDVLGLLGFRYAKCQIAPASPGHRWRLRLVLQRPGHTSRGLHEYALGPNPDPFFLACKWPEAGAGTVGFYHAAFWMSPRREELEHFPTTGLAMQESTTGDPLKAGRRVVLLWPTSSGRVSWDPDDLDFKQRVIMDLTERPDPTE